MSRQKIADHRRYYAEALRATAPVLHQKAVVEAFARVPREKFFPAGPWFILPPHFMSAGYMTPDADPRHLYHDVLVSIDKAKGINNGQPSLWARLLDQIDIAPGSRILQIGAGSGYYTALLAELTGKTGKVVAVEYEKRLAALAKRHLQDWKQVTVVAGDGTKHDAGAVDVVVAFAGATHPASLWLKRLANGGRLLMPLTGEDGWGIFLKVTRQRHGFTAESLGPCGFFPCVGGRNKAAAANLRRALGALRGRPVPIKSLHIGTPPSPEARDIWFAGPGFWLSRQPITGRPH